MKKQLLKILIILPVILLLASCDDPVAAKRRPCGQPNTNWVSENKEISFYVDENQLAIGQMTIDNETISFYLTNDMGYGTWLYSLNVLDTHHETMEDQYEYWVCSFVSKEKFVATVVETTFFEVGEEIVFYRQSGDAPIKDNQGNQVNQGNQGTVP